MHNVCSIKVHSTYPRQVQKSTGKALMVFLACKSLFFISRIVVAKVCLCKAS